MTATTTTSETITLDDRAAALIWFAEAANLRHPELDPVLPDVIAALCHPDQRPYADTLFHDLCTAVNERDRFNGDPRGYAHHLEWHADERSLDLLDERMQRDIDNAVWDLLHVAAPCLRCRGLRPRSFWRVALPGTLFCAGHTEAAAA